jgi:hypothetical protein
VSALWWWSPEAPAQVQSGAGAGDITGSGTLNLPAVGAAGTGEVEVAGTGAGALSPINASGTGDVESEERDGAGELVVGPVQATGAGTLEVTGSGAAQLPAIAASGTGLLANRSATVTAARLQASGFVEIDIEFTAEIVGGEFQIHAAVWTNPNDKQTADAGEIPTVIATGALQTVTDISLDEAANPGAVGLGLANWRVGLQQVAPENEPTGTYPFFDGTITVVEDLRTGSGALTLPAVVASGVGEVIVDAAGAASLPAIAASGSGSGEVTGAGAGELPPIEADGAGSMEVAGTGAATLPPINASGSGEFAGAFPVFVAAGTPAGGIGEISPGLPAGWEEGDDLFLFVEFVNNSVVPTATGYTAVPGFPQNSTGSVATQTNLHVLHRQAQVGDTDPTVSPAPTNHQYAVILGFRGAFAAGDPWDVISEGSEATSDTSVLVPGDATTVDDCLIVVAVADALDDASTARIASWANADLANIIERFDAGTIQGNGGGLGIITGEKASAGPYGDTTATLITPSLKAYGTIALKPLSEVSEITGAGALALPSVGAVGSGSVVIGGDGAALLPAVIAAGSGAVIIEGSGALELPAIQVGGTGDQEPFEGLGSLSGSIQELGVLSERRLSEIGVLSEHV